MPRICTTSSIASLFRSSKRWADRLRFQDYGERYVWIPGRQARAFGEGGYRVEELLADYDEHIGDLGDLYEYMLSKLSTAGTNGQFRTPKHIRDLMVQLMDPKAGELVCDPACGTAGFLN